MKKFSELSSLSKSGIAAVVAVSIIAGTLAACSAKNDTSATTAPAGNDTASTGAITVITREDGSGTRGAFIELFGIEEKNDAGEKIDNTISSAEITNSTSVMLTTVAGNKMSMGYISLGSLNDTVKALKVDSAEPTVENIKNGTYKISRPFNIVTGRSVSDTAQDFINYILSDDGQKIVEDNGYISSTSTGAFKSNGSAGEITVAGSSSVTPVMEKLAEAYQAVNTKAKIQIQQSDSTTGVSSVTEGLCDIGMASRELKDSETKNDIKATAIALDGIAVIVNKENTVTDISSANVKSIYTGEITDWANVK